MNSPAPRLNGKIAYRWQNVAIGGGGFVTGIIHNPARPGLEFLRTDVGGAYRLDPATGRWQALLDHLGPEDWNLHGVESLATDPVEPKRLYLAAGTYTAAQVDNGVLFWSDDCGATWGRTALPFKLGGNEAGRGSGERLVVDPLDNRRLWLGTRRDGIWESLDHGRSWHPLAGFPVLPDASAGEVSQPGRYNYLAQAVGVLRIVFDPSSAVPGQPGCRRAWAALSRHQDGLLVTTDGGRTWAPVPGQPEGLRPVAVELAGDGLLYTAWGKDPGPNTLGPGALWRHDPAGGAWTNITPEVRDNGTTPWGIGAIGLDAGNPARLVCSTWYRSPREELFVSGDRGQSWTPLLAQARWDHRLAPYAARMSPHWMSDVALDTFDPGKLRFVTGYGIWTCADIRPGEAGGPTDWVFTNEGLEETVPLALLSPRTSPDQPRLLSGLGDIDGFVHDQLDRSPAAGFDQPGYKNTECLAACPGNPGLLVRSGTTYHHNKIHAAWSQDGGRSWQAFASAPPQAPGAPHPAAAGPICLNADGSRVVWTPRRERPWLTVDRGQTWQPCEGLEGFVRVVPHPEQPLVFHAWDTAAGQLLRSDDGARHFRLLSSGLPVSQDRWGPLAGDLTQLPAPHGWLLFQADNALWVSTDDGRHFAPLPGLEVQVWCTGCPAAGPAGDFPVLYVQGRMAGHSGLFRSDDRGQGWWLLDNPAHGFPTLNLMTGDACIPGRVYLGTGGRGIFYGEPAESQTGD